MALGAPRLAPIVGDRALGELARRARLAGAGPSLAAASAPAAARAQVVDVDGHDVVEVEPDRARSRRQCLRARPRREASAPPRRPSRSALGLQHTRDEQRWSRRHGGRRAQMWASSAVISLTADFASPNSIAVLGS